MSENKSRLQIRYEKEIKPLLKKELKISNDMAVPTLTKIVINSGLGESLKDKKILENMIEDLSMLSGQKPIVTKSRKAISNFKLKEGEEIGIKVTLRRNMMWYFFDRLISIVLPRIKDFRGVKVNAFDKNGNYSLGISEHTVFPEVDSTKVIKIKGLQIVICTSAKDDERAFMLLKKLGMPFKSSTFKKN